MAGFVPIRRARGSDNPLRSRAYIRRLRHARRFLRLQRVPARRVLSCGPMLIESETSERR